jgi:cellulose synthase/poly-beta-1,6-N-acetylglucosamine synthase-like glycosyltransferase
MLWTLRDLLNLYVATPPAAFAFAFGLQFFDYFFTVPRHFLHRALYGPPRALGEEMPSGLVVVPTLLRGEDELAAIEATLDNVVANHYPGDLVVVASIDGTDDAPALYASLRAWVGRKQEQLDPRVWLYVTGTPRRHGKPMAIDHAVQFLRERVGRGAHREFPRIYFSTDADADLGPHALEHLARRLCRRNRITGSPGRAVAGNLYVRGNSYWRGWRRFFGVEGQLSIQVAREYLVTNVARHNKRPFPLSGVTGVLYCMWTEIFLEAPRFLAFQRTLRLRDWLRWWIGFEPPRFSRSDIRPLPELLAGDTDDTVSAFLAIVARWENGRFTLDAPPTPLHAAWHLLRSYLWDRALRYEPEARVYTSSPTTVRTLWKQRVRWNTARIEVAGRFWRAFAFHWDLGVFASGVVLLMFKYVFFGLFYYVHVPLALATGSLFQRVAIATGIQLGVYSLWTLLALALNGDFRRNWRLLLAIPVAPWYVLVFSFWTTVTGVFNDVFLTGNVTRFAPESTLIHGGSERLALFARLRRAVALTVRAALYGDVPFGTFWFGWDQTRWTPSEYQGWTTGQRPTWRARLRFGAPVVTKEEPNAPGVTLRASLPGVRLWWKLEQLVSRGAAVEQREVVDREGARADEREAEADGGGGGGQRGRGEARLSPGG